MRSHTLIPTAVFVALIAGCGEPPTPNLPGQRLHVVLVDTAPAPPQMFDGRCLIRAPAVSTEDAYHYNAEPAISTFLQIGESVMQCLDGKAEQIPESWAQPFFEQTLWFNLDGKCPPNVFGCYYPSNPTIDRSYITDLTPARAVPTTVGHEVWHAVAGYFHPQ